MAVDINDCLVLAVGNDHRKDIKNKVPAQMLSVLVCISIYSGVPAGPRRQEVI